MDHSSLEQNLSQRGITRWGFQILHGNCTAFGGILKASPNSTEAVGVMDLVTDKPVEVLRTIYSFDPLHRVRCPCAGRTEVEGDYAFSERNHQSTALFRNNISPGGELSL